MYRDRRLTLNELNAAITAYIRNISQAVLQKMFANKIKRVQACIDARGHHFQTCNTFYKCTATYRTHCTWHFEGLVSTGPSVKVKNLEYFTVLWRSFRCPSRMFTNSSFSYSVEPNYMSLLMWNFTFSVSIIKKN